MVRRPFYSQAYCALLAFLLPSGVIAQTADDAAREVQRLRVQVEQERKAISQDSARQAEWRSQSKARVASMRSEAQRLAKERDSLRQTLDRSSKPRPPAPAPVTPAAARKKAFSEALAREIEKTSNLLVHEMDGGAELKEQWSRLANGLRRGSEDPSEALARFLDDVSERIDMAQRISSHPGSFTDASGRTLRGTFLEVGAALQVFVEREGTKAAVRVRGESALREVGNPHDVAKFAHAAKILAGTGDPGWVYLPVAGAVK
jgi:hypothetical protein